MGFTAQFITIVLTGQALKNLVVLFELYTAPHRRQQVIVKLLLKPPVYVQFEINNKNICNSSKRWGPSCRSYGGRIVLLAGCLGSHILSQK